MSTYQIKDIENYHKEYQQSIDDPAEFWNNIAEQNFTWYRKWSEVYTADLSRPEVKWFDGAQLNITENCIDRHLETRGDQTALLFEPNDPEEAAQHISYAQLHESVCRFANVLKSKGISKGDRVIIYLPMIPELAYAVLACARIGAIHSVVFAGFSASALSTRIEDCGASMVITADGSYRGAKTIDLKGIVDEALQDCSGVINVLVARRIRSTIHMDEKRDHWLQPLIENASTTCVPEIMNAEDPLFILYTSGSTGRPKGMLHTTAGYMVYTAYTFQNVFQYQQGDVYWCTADIGWITGHSYILYGPLANGATSVMFEGVPSYPDYGRFWQIVEKYKINQFYTAPTAIRALAKEGIEHPQRYDLSSIRVLGTVGEPINEEAWHWYDEHIGKKQAPIVDTWWQTETGGIMISSLAGITDTKPTYATLALPGILPVLMDAEGNEIQSTKAEGRLCIKNAWPSMARTIWGDHDRYRDTYFTAFPNYYFTGDGALRNEAGQYRITGRVDDVIIVSGHNLGTAPIEDAINEHSAVAESAIVGFAHDIKGNALYGYVTLISEISKAAEDALKKEINQLITKRIGPIAKLDKIQFVKGLPKTRSGKIMRRILRKIASNETEELGDISTLLNPEVVKSIISDRLL